MRLPILVSCSNITGCMKKYWKELWEFIRAHSQFWVRKRATVSNLWQNYVLLVESLYKFQRFKALRNWINMQPFFSNRILEPLRLKWWQGQKIYMEIPNVTITSLNMWVDKGRQNEEVILNVSMNSMALKQNHHLWCISHSARF